MRKLFLLSMALALILLSAGGAWAAYTFPNNTLVQSYNGHSEYNWNGYWHDVIGELSIYETYGANLSGQTLTIFTNWGGLIGPGFSDHTATTADLFIDTNLDKTWDAAIRLDGNNQGKIYYNPTPKTSEDFFASQTRYVYGGRYNNAPPNSPLNPVPVPVQATSSPSNDSSLVTWTHLTGNPNWSIAIDLSQVDNFDPGQFAFIWATGTCANDTAQGQILSNQSGGQVPLPPSMLLLGSGLLGLVGLGWRRSRKAS